jgi:high-affinity iron transporter
MTGQIIFILWRESIEALLVIGILASWLAERQAGPRASAFLWGGVAAGFGLALGFAALVLGFSEILPDAARAALMTAMVFLASGLILQMVVWMRAHGRTLKREMQSGLDHAARQERWGAVFLLAMIAVAREGSETVVFLYGTLAAAGGGSLAAILGAMAAGLAAAAATYALLRLGSRFLPWRRFFRLSEGLLLLLGCALFTTGAGDLVAQGVLPFGPAVWNLSGLLDDTSPLGGLVAALTGYRAAPDAVTLAAWAVYWAIVWLALHYQRRRAAQTPVARASRA